MEKEEDADVEDEEDLEDDEDNEDVEEETDLLEVVLTDSPLISMSSQSPEVPLYVYSSPPL